MSEQRYIKAEFAAWMAIFVNLLLAIVKGLAGIITGSIVLIADAAHTVSDAVRTFAVLIGIKQAKMPSGRNAQQFRQGRKESIAFIVVSVLVLIIGVELGITAIKALISGNQEPPTYGWLTFSVLIVALLVSEVLYQYKYKLSKQLSGQALSIRHWEHRTYMLTLAIATVGICGAMAGEVLHLPKLSYLDAGSSLIITMIVIKKGYALLIESIHSTLDQALHQEESQELIHTVQTIKGVITVDELRAREYGHYVVVEVIISVNPKLTVWEGQEIARCIKAQLLKKYSHISDVYIHVNPYDSGYPFKNNLDSEYDDLPNYTH